MAAPDLLFNLRNNFYLGAYQAAINNSEIPNVSPDEAVERDCLVYRSYIALGSNQLVISEIDASAATPLQAVKLLALYLSASENKVRPLRSATILCVFFFMLLSQNNSRSANMIRHKKSFSCFSVFGACMIWGRPNMNCQTKSFLCYSVFNRKMFPGLLTWSDIRNREFMTLGVLCTLYQQIFITWKVIEVVGFILL